MTEEQKIELLDRVVVRLDELRTHYLVRIHEKYCFAAEYAQQTLMRDALPKVDNVSFYKGGYVLKFHDYSYDIEIKIQGVTMAFQDINMIFLLDFNNGAISIVPDETCKNTSFTISYP